MPEPSPNAAMEMNAVELSQVTKRFGQHTAVDEVSLEVPRGSIYGFIGPNGSGKTTTMRMIMNIFYPDTGSIRVFGAPLRGACTERIGYLPEERGLYKKMKVREVLRFYTQLKCGKNVSRQVDEWLERLQLSEWADKKVEALSKGMSQKAQFIGAVATEPDLLILDEPFSGLDPVNADLLTGEIVALRDQGKTVILSTHDMSTAERMCDFVFMVFQGKKVLDGTLASIQSQYGRDTIRLRAEGAVPALAELPGVERVLDHGRQQELRLAADGDPQAILALLVGRCRLLSFEVSQPSLHDIFVRIAGGNTKEPQDV